MTSVSSRLGIVLVLLTVIPAVGLSLYMDQLKQPLQINNTDTDLGYIVIIKTDGHSYLNEDWGNGHHFIINDNQSELLSDWKLALNYTHSDTKFYFYGSNSLTDIMMRDVMKKYSHQENS